MQSLESVGGIKMDAELDLGKAEAGVRSYKEVLTEVNKSMGTTEQGFIKLESASEASAGSINSLNARYKELRDQLNRLDPETRQYTETAKSLNIVMTELKYAHDKAKDSTVGLKEGMEGASVASRGLSVAMGVLGAQSVEAVVFKMVQLTKEAIQTAIVLQGVECRAKAIYGDSFPQMTQATEKLATSLRRSASDILEYSTGFATVLDSVGATKNQINKYSLELTNLSVVLGKAHPELSDADIYQKIEYGIMGNVRGLRELGIMMTAKQLQDFADSERIKVRVKDMTDEQLVMLRTQFLLKETAKQQEAGAESAGKLGDSIKTTKASWHDFLETLGQDLSPFVVASNNAILGMLKDWYGWIKAVGGAFAGLFEMDKKTALIHGSVQKVFGPFQDEAVPPSSAAPTASGSDSTPAGFWDNHSASGSGAKEEKKDKAELKKITEDILKAESDGAKNRMELLKIEREDLETKRKMHDLTHDEEEMLKRINNRVEFKKQLVSEVTKEWEKQVEALKQLDQKITDINKKMLDEQKNFKKQLGDVDEQANDDKTKKAEDLVKELNEINKKIGNGEGNQVELENRRRVIDGMLDPMRGTKDGKNILQTAEANAGMNDFQKIDQQAAKKKKELAEQHNDRLSELTAELAGEQLKRDQVANMEKQKRDLVSAALDDRKTLTETNYKALEDATQKHIQKQIEQFNQLASSLNAIANAQNGAATTIEKRAGQKMLPGFATGGPIFGPGGPTDDSIPILVSNGEAIVNARGYSSNRGIVDAINAGMRFDLPRFAEGGPVSSNVNNSRSVQVTQNFHGETARVFGRPDMQRWHARFANR